MTDISDSAPSEEEELVDFTATLWNVHKFGAGGIRVLASLQKAISSHGSLLEALSKENFAGGREKLFDWLYDRRSAFSELALLRQQVRELDQAIQDKKKLGKRKRKDLESEAPEEGAQDQAGGTPGQKKGASKAWWDAAVDAMLKYSPADEETPEDTWEKYRAAWESFRDAWQALLPSEAPGAQDQGGPLPMDVEDTPQDPQSPQEPEDEPADEEEEDEAEASTNDTAESLSAEEKRRERELQQRFLADQKDLFEKTEQLHAATKSLLRTYEAAERAHDKSIKLRGALRTHLQEIASGGPAEATESAEATELIEMLNKLETFFDDPPAKPPFQDQASRVRYATAVLRRMLHKTLVVERIANQFDRNPAVEVMLLNEVNAGVGVLAEELAERGLELVAGPKLSSNNGHYTEYYPLVIRKGGRVKHIGVEPGGDYTFSKADKTYRPIIVHTVEVDGVPVRIGIVHTTPFGKKNKEHYTSEFERKKVYEQLDNELKRLVERSEKDGVPLIIGGDYYLGPEARVQDLRDVRQHISLHEKNLQRHLLEAIWDREKVKAKVGADVARKSAAWVADQRSKGVPEQAIEDELRKRRDSALERFYADVAGEHREMTDAGELHAWVERLLEQMDLLANPKGISRRVLKNRLLKAFALKNPTFKDILSLTDPLLNQLRNVLGITSEAQFSKVDLELLAPLTGTNWKKPRVESWFHGQIADYFLAWKPGLAASYVGLGNRFGLPQPADDEELSVGNYWQLASDHFLVSVALLLRKDGRRRGASSPATSSSSDGGEGGDDRERRDDRDQARPMDEEDRPLDGGESFGRGDSRSQSDGTGDSSKDTGEPPLKKAKLDTGDPPPTEQPKTNTRNKRRANKLGGNRDSSTLTSLSQTLVKKTNKKTPRRRTKVRG